MPGVHRLGDVDTGHGCFGGRPTCQASPNVLVNGKGACRVGDKYNSHCCVTCHDGVVSVGSPNVFVNGKAVARIGDAVSCGGNASAGSGNVFAN